MSYEQHKGNVLPPPAAIERQMEQLGVSPKQKERARQKFMKSATLAGFIDPATGRFIKPGNVSPKAVAPPRTETDKGGNDGNEPPGLHPFIQGLLRELPKAGEVWPEAKRKLWLNTAESIFKMIYKDSLGPRTGSSPSDAVE